MKIGINTSISSKIGLSIGGGGESASLDTVWSGAQFDFRATQYSSGQIWTNQITGTGIDATLGANDSVATDDPTFSTDKFTVDGGDFFNTSSFAGTIVEDWHKSANTGWTFIVAGKFPTAGTIWFTGNTVGGGANNGVYIYKDASERIRFSTTNSGAVNGVYTGAIGSVPNDVELLFILSVNNSSGSIRYWSNSRTKVSDTYSISTATGTATGTLSFAGVDGGAVKSATGAEFRAFALGSGFIDDAEAADIIDFYNEDLGITYA